MSAEREILPLRDAARRVPMREAVARKWLRDSGLVATVEGRELVIWPDVLEALRMRAAAPAAPAAPRPVPPTLAGRRRASL